MTLLPGLNEIHAVLPRDMLVGIELFVDVE